MVLFQINHPLSLEILGVHFCFKFDSNILNMEKKKNLEKIYNL